MRTIKQVENEIWELSKKMYELQIELDTLLEDQREKIRSCINKDGSWDLKKLKEWGLI